jgi:hypothetical protein
VLHALQKVQRGDAEEMEAEHRDGVADPALFLRWIDACNAVKNTLKGSEGTRRITAVVIGPNSAEARDIAPSSEQKVRPG